MIQPPNSSKPEVKVHELIKAKSFDKVFSKLIGSAAFKTHEEAFAYMNEVYFQHFGVDRYSSFESYRVARSKRLRS